MALVKRGRFWYMIISCNGKRIRKSTDTANRRLAEKIHAKTLALAVEGKFFEKPKDTKKTFQEMMEKYMNEYSIPKKASSERDRYSLKHLLPFFGKQKIISIAPSTINRYKTKRRQEKASPETINKELNLMSHAFNMAIKEWEWLEQNPVWKVSKEKKPLARDRWLDYDEEIKLLNASPGWIKEFIVFAVETGCRQGEIISLCWKDIDFQRETVTVFGSKTGERRTIPLSERAFQLLEGKARVRQLKSDSVFPSSSGGEMNRNNLRRAFKRAVKSSGIEHIRFHDLRHTFATRYAQKGIDSYSIQKLLGHKTASMTQRYAHHNIASLKNAVNAFDKTGGKKVTQICHNRGKSRKRLTGNHSKSLIYMVGDVGIEPTTSAV